MDNILLWLSNWFKEHCDSDWEHENQIIIQTIDNPGWLIEISLRDTSLQDLSITMDTVIINDNDWYFFDFKDGHFRASGDLEKLEFLLLKFKQGVVEASKS